VKDEEFLKLLNRGLPKWPQMIVTGPQISEDLALEVIRRTDSWFVSAHGCNDHEGDRRLAQRFRMPHFHDHSSFPEGFNWRHHWDRCARWSKAWGAIETQYVRNNWIGSPYIHGPHGWCHPNGRIHHVDNVGKWPAVEEIHADWQLLATAFPFLVLTVTLMSGEYVEEDAVPVVSMDVADGRVTLKEPIDIDPVPRRTFDNGAAARLFTSTPALRERYPFREDVMRAWEKKALEVDAEIATPIVPEGAGTAVFQAIDTDATCMPWEEFLTSCRDGTLMDEDGFGELATDLQVSDVQVVPTDVLSPFYARPSWATHVCWYNK